MKTHEFNRRQSRETVEAMIARSPQPEPPQLPPFSNAPGPYNVAIDLLMIAQEHLARLDTEHAETYIVAAHDLVDVWQRAKKLRDGGLSDD